MKSYQNILAEIKSKIIENKLTHENSIIIGDNSSGKSEVLQSILKEDIQGYYFIDSVNRSFDYEKASRESNFENTYRDVVRCRIKENYFNLQDSFDIFRLGTTNIENIYYNYEIELKDLIKSFLGIELDIVIGINKVLVRTKTLLINGEEEKLSSGYQALIRIFLEVLYFENNIMDNIKNPIILIDEINEFLSVKNEQKIIPFLVEKFPRLKFVITTYSSDIMVNAENFNIVVLNKNNYEILDSNDFVTNTDVREIFENLYGREENIESDIEMTLRNLLSLKITENWGSIEEDKLKNIDSLNLTTLQKLLLKQIKEW